MLRRLVPRPVVPGLRGRAAPGVVPAACEPLVPPAPDLPVDAFGDFKRAPIELVASLKAELAHARRQCNEARNELARVRARLGEAHRAAAQASPEALSHDVASLTQQQRQRIVELQRELEEVKLERVEVRANFECHLEERARQRTAQAGFDLVPSLQEANQALRARLRTETDRAVRAERRALAAEQQLACFAASAQTGRHWGGARTGPGVVTVDGAEVVVPWGSRT